MSCLTGSSLRHTCGAPRVWRGALARPRRRGHRARSDLARLSRVPERSPARDAPSIGEPRGHRRRLPPPAQCRRAPWAPRRRPPPRRTTRHPGPAAPRTRSRRGCARTASTPGSRPRRRTRNRYPSWRPRCVGVRRLWRRMRTAPFASASRVVSPLRTSVASSDIDFVSFAADANPGSTPCARNHAASESGEPPVQDVASSGEEEVDASEPTARVDIAPEVEDDVGVHAVRRCSARLAPASALALWRVGRGLSARDARVDAAAQERRARHEARHMCGEATSPSSSSSAITSPVVKQLLSRLSRGFREPGKATVHDSKKVNLMRATRQNQLQNIFPRKRTTDTMKQYIVQ